MGGTSVESCARRFHRRLVYVLYAMVSTGLYGLCPVYYEVNAIEQAATATVLHGNALQPLLLRIPHT